MQTKGISCLWLICHSEKACCASKTGGNEEADRRHIFRSWTPLVAPHSIVQLPLTSNPDSRAADTSAATIVRPESTIITKSF